MNQLKKVTAFYFIVGGIFLGLVAVLGFLDIIKESFSQRSSIIAFGVVFLLALGLCGSGSWMIRGDLSSLILSREKSQPLTLVIASLAAPFMFLYLGGWRVFLPIAIVGIGTDLLAAALNPKSAELSEFMLPNMPYALFRVLGLVYFQYGLCYLHVYNKHVEEGRNVEEIQSFKWGLYICISLSYGIVLVYTGILVFAASFTWSGSFLKAITLSICSLYLVHRGMSWIQRWVKDYIVRKYSATQEEFAEYQLFKYPRYLV